LSVTIFAVDEIYPSCGSDLVEWWMRTSRVARASDSYGWERNFAPKKFRGIDSERFPLFRGRKGSFRGIPNSVEEQIPKLGTEQNGAEFREKMKFYGTD
jgi:hypothetical protein